MTTDNLTLPQGLSTEEVRQSRNTFGSNGLTAQKSTGFFRKLLESLSDPILKLMLVALAANVLLLCRGQGWFETAGIALAVFLASFISTLSEYSSERAFRRLQEEAARTTCRLRREGRTVTLPTPELVRGDLVLLESGEGIPADGLLIQGKLTVDQSALTGESKEVHKFPDPSGKEPQRATAQHPSMLLRGCSVTGGRGVMRVLQVGDRTLFGSMARSLQEQPRESPLKLRLEHLASRISRLGMVAALLVAGASLFRDLVVAEHFDLDLIWAELHHMKTLVNALLHAATMAIGILIVAVPEGLPMMITVVLSRSMLRMQKDKVMVRKLTGIETAGSLSLLFTDKTGTLTHGRLEAQQLLCYGGRLLAPAPLAEHPALHKAVAFACRLGSPTQKTPGGYAGGNATDRALFRFAEHYIPALPRAEALLPFDSARKYSAAAVEGTAYYKGAPERLLPLCTTALDLGGNEVPLAASALPDWQQYAKQGYRIVALCRGRLWQQDRPPDGLTLIGLLLLRDGLRPQTAGAIKLLRRAGIRVVMLTGDSPDTAAAIAREAGLLDADGLVLTGTELQEMTDDQLFRALPRLQVLARVLPTDKSRLVRLAQQAGLVAGMTGDGVNDAPALRLADVGFAMGSGTQVAKDAGDIIILDDDIASIAKAVLYGRTIFRSIQRFVVFQLTINFCAVAISLMGPFIGIDTPVTVVQMLWINLIMDTLAGLAFAGEPTNARRMAEPPKRRDAPILTRSMLWQIMGLALIIIALCLGFLDLPLVRVWFPTERSWLTGFFALFVFCGIAGAFCARTEGIHLLRGLGHNPSFLLIMTTVAGVQLALLYLGGDLFRTHGLTLTQLGITAALAFSVLPLDLVGKSLRSAGKSSTIKARNTARRFVS